jgi:hypothetical protein
MGLLLALLLQPAAWALAVGSVNFLPFVVR